ncbi:Oidioi.mRNA.OKI2018_I69.PAR.g12482.t1.cds [Oikopleura dioica]|uniref:Oidioi.mRNA.OKI2018_I69.PAR.g12482.t1.cds n=1 Tax=Oikopleura dioica TaxID=34765 RepID=A0ABN7S0T8_OIKDI|nr:Oidioi.mRNA.OKI2018_I69.PAR.g12482.t1.cds [Oikopleura dioica]
MVDKEMAKRAETKRKYEARISQLLETIEAEKENFSGKQAEFSNYQRKLREQSLELEKTNNDKNQLNRQISQLQDEIDQHEQDLRDFQTLQKDYKSLENRNIRLQSKLDEINAIKRERDELSQNLLVSEAEARSKREQLEKLRNELDVAKAKCVKIKSEYDSVIKKERANVENRNEAIIREFEQQINELENTIDEQNRDLKQLQAQVRQISQESDEYQSQLAMANEKIQSLEWDYKQSKKELESMKRKESSQAQNLEHKISEIEDERDVLMANLNAKNSEMAQLKTILTNTEDDRNDLVRQLSAAREEHAQLRREHDSRQKKDVESEASQKLRLDELKIENQRLNRDIESLSQQLDDKEHDVADLRISCEEKQSQVEDLQDRLRNAEDNQRQRALEVSRIEQNREADRLQSQLDLKNADLRRAIEQESRLQTKLDTLQSDYELLLSQVEDRDTELENIRSQMVSLEAERDDLLLTVSQQDASKKSDDAETKKEARRELESARREFKNEKDLLRREIVQLDRQVVTLKENYRKLETEHAEERDESQRLRQELLRANDNSGDVQAKADQISALKIKMRVLEQEKATLMEAVDGMEDEVNGKESEIQKLQHEIRLGEKERKNFEKIVIEERARAEAVEAEFNVRNRRTNDDDLKIETLEEEIEQLERRFGREREKLTQENELLSAQNRDLQKKLQRKDREIIEAEDERLGQIEESDQQVVELMKKLKSERAKRDLMEQEFQKYERDHLESVRAMKLDQATAMEHFKETKKLQKEIDQLTGQVLAEREKNNQFKHENSDLKIDQERNRQINHQQAKLIEMLQRQNEELTPKKLKKKNKGMTPNYAPPPLYKDLEKQIDQLRVENSKLKSKLYGSNTDLDKIPTKAKLSSKSREASPRKKDRNFNGNLLYLYRGEWARVTGRVEGTSLVLAGDSFEEAIDLKSNIALHGAVCFDHVKFMAEVDHEFCFGIEHIPASFGSKYRPEMEYFCALNLSDKQNWFETLKDIVNSPPSLPANDHNKFDVQKVHSFQDKIPDICCSTQIDGYTLIGSTDNLLATDGKTIVVASKAPIVELESFEDLVFGIGYRERYPVFFYADGVRSLIRSKVQITFNRITKERVHVIKAGRYQGKYALAAAFNTTIKLFQFSKQHALDKEYEVLEVLRVKLDSAPSSLAFSSSSLICGTDRIIEVDFHKQTAEPYLAESELRKTHQEKPIDMFALYDGGKERHLICGQHGGYLVDNCGRIVQRINWSSLPLDFKYSEPYLFVSHMFGIELVKIGIAQVSQPIILSSFRPRLLGVAGEGQLILLSRPYGEKRSASATVKILSGTEEIEYDEAISGPSSLNSHIGLAYRPSRAYRQTAPRIEPRFELQNETTSSGMMEYSVYR